MMVFTPLVVGAAAAGALAVVNYLVNKIYIQTNQIILYYQVHMPNINHPDTTKAQGSCSHPFS